ncbi:AHH domain-containing protein [Marinibactrum halimedae]|uniref:Uncharacterized protein n=1 Tax=Marinibactrum halimedae TaxID=1444977 RepID=A0AA37WMV4_9GAMM|nr:AHH domain-containing protein [Marinibactrum halimedae]MCD9457413.1 AHH domain-containing protein [Marinibactrum halimedae]GLS25536.1 hypothetical protein GCM10007877_12500 [Marinibactrum halimedae]
MLPHHGMPIEKPYVFKSLTERAIDKFVGIEKPTAADLNMLKVTGQVEAGVQELLGYVHDGYSNKSRTELEEEVHNSQKLGARMAVAGDTKPHSLCHAHAIISGGHPLAATLRGILAKYKIRIDDSDNGCWLPENTEAKRIMGSAAVPHSRIHRKNYYRWMDTYIRLPITKDESHCRFQLIMIKSRLLNMVSLPDYVMLPAGAKITS